MRDLKGKTLNSGMWRLSLPSFFERLIVVSSVLFMADIIADFPCAVFNPFILNGTSKSITSLHDNSETNIPFWTIFHSYVSGSHCTFKGAGIPTTPFCDVFPGTL